MTMNFNVDQAIGAGFGTLVTFGLKKLVDVAGLFPAWLAAREKARFAKAVADGKIPPVFARFLKSQARAAFVWAAKEIPASPGPRKMDEVMGLLQGLPWVGILVSADAADVRRLLEVEYAAMKAEVIAETEAAAVPAAVPAADPPEA